MLKKWKRCLTCRIYHNLMKNIKVLILIFHLLILTSCEVMPDNFTSQEVDTSTPKYTDSFIESSETMNATTNENEPYSFSEVNSLFGPDLFTLNELKQTFGEITSIYSYYRNDGYLVVSAIFDDVMFDLTYSDNDDLNSIPVKTDRYEISDLDMDIRMKPQYVAIWGGDWILPREIKLGDSIEALYTKYNGNRGSERSAQGEFLVSYNYGESGKIIYHFDDKTVNGLKSGINQVTIQWYSTTEPNCSTQSNNTPYP